MKSFYFNYLFAFGLIIRLIFIFILIPDPVDLWFGPFLESSVALFNVDPWRLWLESGGSSMAFPYGYAMWFCFIPFFAFAALVGLSAEYAYFGTILIADIFLLRVLKFLLPNRNRLILFTYWLSPIVIFATYALGVNDIIPAVLLMTSIFCIKNIKPKWSAAFLAAAISSKLSMILALPFMAIYLYQNKSIRRYIPGFSYTFLILVSLLQLPFLLSSSASLMLFSNPELVKVYELSVNLGSGISILVTPLLFIVLVYVTWRIGRINFDLFISLIGLSFLMIVLLTPGSPGWFIWTLPFLVIYQAKSGKKAIVLVSFFSLLYVFSTLLNARLIFKDQTYFDLSNFIELINFNVIPIDSIIHTLMIIAGILLTIRIWRESVSGNDYFRQSRKPLMLGVAGDSGAGKDTFSDAIINLFGSHSMIKLSGDDYHLWDRQKPMWQVMTHLNPMANDLEGFANDVITLGDGKNIKAKHYDHSIGKMSKPVSIKTNDFIIVNGLHALYLPILRDSYNLRIFLDIDEGLRKYFKVRRDHFNRGHSIENILESIENRKHDSERFIKPQRDHADIIFKLLPVNKDFILDYKNEESDLRLKLIVSTQNGAPEASLTEVLIGICGLHVDVWISKNGIDSRMTIEGEINSEDIGMAARMLYPEMLEFLDIYPKWENGMVGIMQLITISYIRQAMKKRFN